MTWNACLTSRTATHHRTNFQLIFQCSRSDVRELTPLKPPQSISPVELVMLIREGRDAIERELSRLTLEASTICLS